MNGGCTSRSKSSSAPPGYQCSQRAGVVPANGSTKGDLSHVFQENRDVYHRYLQLAGRQSEPACGERRRTPTTAGADTMTTAATRALTTSIARTSTTAYSDYRRYDDRYDRDDRHHHRVALARTSPRVVAIGLGILAVGSILASESHR